MEALVTILVLVVLVMLAYKFRHPLQNWLNKEPKNDFRYRKKELSRRIEDAQDELREIAQKETETEE